MSSFAGYLCWDPRSVQATIASDVAAAHESTLLATHQSVPLVRCSPNLDPEVQVSEQEVLQSFLGSTSDPLLMAVVGPAGTGKSHLIRWINAQLQGETRYRVIYVPRHSTNLRSVLRRILTGLPGDAPRQLLRDLETATSSLIPDQAAAVLLDQLCNVIEFQPPPATGTTDQALRSQISGVRMDGTRHPGLADVLRLPQYRKHLLGDDGVIASYVTQTFGERQDGEPPSTFGPTDLHVSLRVDPREWLPPPAHEVYVQIMSNERWAAQAACLLNESLEEALGQVLGLQGGIPLADVVTESRVLLRDEGLELILLIEDFALLQNKIDRQLLDALLVPTATASEDTLRCPIRTAFAITDHPYLELPETLRTRLGLLFSTSIPFDDAGGSEAAARFVAAYLNAARVGVANLDEAFQAAATSERTSTAWVPNHCDGCDHRSVCHDEDEGFGSSGGFGLYPYNRKALERVLGSVLPDGRFDQRTLVSRVVGDILDRDAFSIEGLSFPSAGFRRRFPPSEDQRSLPAEVREAIDASADPDRRAILLEFWGGVPDEAVNLGDHIHEAFGISRLEDARPVSQDLDGDQARFTGATPGPQPARLQPPGVLEFELSAIDDWLAQPDRGLSQELANRLRHRLHEYVLARIPWNDELLSPNLDEVDSRGAIFAAASFQIEGASKSNPSETAVRFPIRRTPEDALLLKAVLQFERSRQWSARNGARQYLKLMTRLDGYAADVLAAVRRYGASPQSRTPLRPALEALILSARILGLPGAFGPDLVDVVRAALSPSVDSTRPEAASLEWRSLYDAAASELRPKTQAFVVSFVQASQGQGGAVLALDLTQLISIADELDSSTRLSDIPRHAPSELRQFRAQLEGLLDRAIDEESSRLLGLSEAIADLGPLNLPRLVGDLRNAGQMASDHGFFPDYGEFGALCEALSALDARQLVELPEAAAALKDEPSTCLRAIVELQPVATRADQLLWLLGAAEPLLVGAIRRLESELQQSPDLDGAMRRAAALLSEIGKTLFDIGGKT